MEVKVITQLKESEPFYKDGFYGDIEKIRAQMNMLENENNNIEEIMKMSTELPYYKCWCHDSMLFCDGVEQIEKDFPVFFPSELLVRIENLLELVKPIKNLTNFVEMKDARNFGILPKQFYSHISKFPVDFFLDTYKPIEVLERLESVMIYIEQETGESIRKRDIKFFNNRNVSPKLGSACKNIDNI